jgi:hypothetical protein
MKEQHHKIAPALTLSAIALSVSLSTSAKTPPDTIPAPAKDVTVVNTPLPVTGEIDADVTIINNASSPVPVTGTVEISGTPKVDVDTTTDDPLIVQQLLSEPINFTGQTSVFQNSATGYYIAEENYTVPDGKRLTLEAVSLMTAAPPETEYEFAVFCDGVKFTLSAHRSLPLFAEDVGTLETVYASEPVTCHIPAGANVLFQFKTPTPTTFSLFYGFTGFLESTL